MNGLNMSTTGEFVKVESSKSPFFEGGVLYSELSAWLESNGFECVRPLKKNQEHGDTIWKKTDVA